MKSGNGFSSVGETHADARVVLVTGGSGSIGGAICKEIATSSTTVVVHWHENQDAARDVVETISKGGGRAIAYRADLCSTRQVEAMVEYIADCCGHLDVLINAAGTIRSNLLLALTDAEIDDVVNVNIRAVMFVTRAAVRRMIENHSGAIISLSSMAASRPRPGYSHYAASKAAIEGFTQALAVELAPMDIRVNAVSPGIVITESTRMARESMSDVLLKEVPLRRFATTSDVAKAVSFLASEDAAYITGHILKVSGGR